MLEFYTANALLWNRIVVKKLFAIWLLATFLFNLGGYYVFFWALKVQAKKELSVKLDQDDYNDQETFEIKIPLSLPYPLQSNGFQRQSGHFVYNQEHYQLVKQQYANDTLTIIAIKDAASNQISKAMDTFSESSTNSSKQDGALNITVKILSEYISNNHTELNNISGWSRDIVHDIFFTQHEEINLTGVSPPPRFS